MTIKHTLSGVSASDEHLTVYFMAEGETWMRFGHVKVPLVMLIEGGIPDAMDRAVRRALIQSWSEVDLADPLW